MKELTLATKVFLAKLLRGLYYNGEVGKDVLPPRLGSPISDLLHSLEILGIVKNEGGKVTKGEAYYLGYDVIFTYSTYRIAMSSKGDRSFRTKKEIACLVPLTERKHVMQRHHYSRAPKALRLSKVRVRDYLKGRAGTGTWKVEERGQNLDLRLIFDPPLEPGQFASYGYSTWDKEYYGTSVDEIRRRYGIDYSSEGVAVTSPTLYLKLTVMLPWKPGSIGAYTMVRKPDGNFSFREINRGYVFRGDSDTYTLEMENPDLHMYSVRWTPPSKKT
ncbi:hypothetical protein [Metallosphaera sedula]|uniref:hypothetical protein n=1 Tax=Metallosphaera sedula TaxID=43687 RepID=UPI0020C08BF4|nr:hypothetical protein [Metallosphaera sedula]BBL46934.1 hypothetical protein MJ1HA_1035 [Metallosphaera sedula]